MRFEITSMIQIEFGNNGPPYMSPVKLKVIVASYDLFRQISQSKWMFSK